MRGPTGVCAEASETTLLEECVRGIVSEGDVDSEHVLCRGEGGGGRRDEDATGWEGASGVSRGGGLKEEG